MYNMYWKERLGIWKIMCDAKKFRQYVEDYVKIVLLLSCRCVFWNSCMQYRNVLETVKNRIHLMRIVNKIRLRQLRL